LQAKTGGGGATQLGWHHILAATTQLSAKPSCGGAVIEIEINLLRFHVFSRIISRSAGICLAAEVAAEQPLSIFSMSALQ